MVSPIVSPIRSAAIASFLDIVVDQSAETAVHFLEAACWVVDDALELFYGRDHGCPAICYDLPVVRRSSAELGHCQDSSFATCLDVPHASSLRQLTESSTKNCTSELLLARSGKRHVEEVVTNASSCNRDNMRANSVPPAPRKARRTRAQIIADEARCTFARPPVSSRKVPPPRRPDLTCGEANAVRLLSVSVSQPTLPVRLPGSDGASASVRPTDTVIRRKRRTRAEIDAAAAGVMPIACPQFVICKRRRSASEMAASALCPPPTAGLPGADSLVRRMSPVQQSGKLQQPPLPSGRKRHLPLVRSGASRVPKRTRLQLDADFYAPPSSAIVTVFKALGMSHVPTVPLALPEALECRFCGAYKFAYECPSLCCGNGKIRLADIEIPAQLQDLIASKGKLGDHFRDYCRAYNNYFAFSCLGGVIDASNASGFFTFLLQGQIYHFLPNLMPDNEGPKFMQLYFYDGAPEFETRCQSFDKLEANLIAAFITLTAANPYAQFFRSLRNFPVQPTSGIRIFRNPVLDQRVYNAPTCDEVAAIILDDESEDRINSPHILVYGDNEHDHGHRIMHYFGCYDPLQYPLLFTKGESGWHQGLCHVSPNSQTRCDELAFPLVPGSSQRIDDIVAAETAASSSNPQKKGKALSCRQYYAYRFQIRQDNFLIHMGRIFVQYIVDMYVKVENTRLDYLKFNQTLLRSELYQGIVDSVNDGNLSAASIGRRVILPASFIGGPRDMKCRYYNAMSLVQRFGKPDIFLTMTCNPKWPEIKDHLLPGEKPGHRPDLVARVFYAKVRALQKLIVEHQIFGPVVARVDVVEFQKRGLPHLHMLIILARRHKIVDPACFDQYVSAELPSAENTRLRSLVERHMMHGPCGDLGPNCACMRTVNNERKCKCDYPKKFAEFTTCTDDAYPTYRRRDTGEHMFVKDIRLDNLWVVPYNAYLLATFDCHLNVEICSTVQAVKYLYKYVYKGHDKVCFRLGPDGLHVEDEISSYQSGRWVSGPESAWRLFEFDLYSMKPTVIPLQLHLPHLHVIRFSESSDLAAIVNDENRGATMLTEFFTANRELEKAHLYLYAQFPEYFTWCKSTKVWKERSGPKCIGRLTYASPSEGERYYLRLLLTHIRGPTSFDDLLSVDNVRCATFKEAAEKHGLLEKDDYAESCMRDAMEVQMPFALRRLFVTLLVFCERLDPRALWDQFYNSLSADFAYRFKGQPTKVMNLTYLDVASLLEGMGKSMRDFNLHECSGFGDVGFRLTRDVIDAVDGCIPDEYINAHEKLNNEQRIAYDAILHHVEQSLPGAFFIDGPGGTGKTFLYCALCATLKSMGKIVLPTATSGIAASNMPFGRTAHSRFKIPIGQSGRITCNISKQSALACLLKKCILIIWDEASMANKKDIECLDRSLQDICGSNALFGGKIVVFGGDFRQVLPVLPHKSQVEVVNSSLLSSYLWPKLQKFKLHINIRAREDAQFSAFLLQLGNGNLQTQGTEDVVLPDFIECRYVEDKCFAELADVMFPEMRHPLFSSDIFAGRAILTPTNLSVDAINEALISEFPGPPVSYTSFDTVVDDTRDLYPVEFLNSLTPSGMSPHDLVLKLGCPVILLRNLDPSNGLCNGTRLICKEFRRNVIVCEIAAGYNKGVRVFIPRISLRPPEDTYPFRFERKQFPIKLCFAMTINKSQGQTLERVCVYLSQSCFAHGQLYVAFSRARMRSTLTVFVPRVVQKALQCNKVVNIVSFDVLQRAGVLAHVNA